MEIIKCFLYDNDCMKTGQECVQTGIVLHSTGANNPNLSRYVQPSKFDEDYDYLMYRIGVNKYNNSWNRSGVKKCVHYMIGYDANQIVSCVQTLPNDICAWGCGSGKYGSFNYPPNAHIQIECCEDNMKNKEYFDCVYNTLVDLCSYLCNELNLSPNSITTHHQAHLLEYASNHADIDKWFNVYTVSLPKFIEDVKERMKNYKEKQFNITVKDGINEYRIKGTIERI